MSQKPKGAEQATEGAWFWHRLDQATADFDSLPGWMKKRPTAAKVKKRSIQASRRTTKRAA